MYGIFLKKMGENEEFFPIIRLLTHGSLLVPGLFSSWGRSAIIEDNSEVTPVVACSTSSISSALAIPTKVSNLGIFTPRSITLIWVVLISISAASAS